MGRRRPPAIGSSRAARVVIDGRELVAFAGCDYLGLAHAPPVVEALKTGLARHGVSSSASRETTGSRVAHEELERDLASALGLPAALCAPSGYLANLIAAQGLAGLAEIALVDAEAHASVRDALLAAGIETIEYAHADARSAAAAHGDRSRDRLVIATDGVFPSLGHTGPLRELLALLPAGRGLLLVDDCHGFGVLGARGRGTLEHLGLEDERIVVTATLSKAVGCFGGVIAGSTASIERMRHRSRAWVGSTPIPPALAEAARSALGLLKRGERLAKLRLNIARMRAGFRQLGLPVAEIELPVFAFAPPETATRDRASPESSARAFELALRERGFLVPCLDYPGFGAAGPYLRLAVSADHEAPEIDALLEALAELQAASPRGEPDR
jgi:8-amino-7-oxononanoate synthase